MTARQCYEAILIELNKENAPNILLEDFNYLFNKAINQYINKRYNIYDINQQTTDDLRVLKATSILPVHKALMYDNDVLGKMMGATYEVNLPSDYLHLLNCICIYKVNKTFKCYNKGDIWRRPATRLTSDIYSQVLDNFWMRPTYRRPYYYIHNVNYTGGYGDNPSPDEFDSETITRNDEIKNSSFQNGAWTTEVTTNPYNESRRSGTDIQFKTTETQITSEQFTNAKEAIYVYGLSSKGRARLDAPAKIQSLQSVDNSNIYYGIFHGTELIDENQYTVDAYEKTGNTWSRSDAAVSINDIFKQEVESDDNTTIKYDIWQPVKNGDYVYFNKLGDVTIDKESLAITKNNTLSYTDQSRGTDAHGTQIINGDDTPLFHTVNIDGVLSSNVERAAKVRYGNTSKVRLELRYGTDDTLFKLTHVYIDYIKAPQNIRLTQEQLDFTEDTSQMLEFPDYVCQEIINELVNIVMENISDQRLQTHPVVSQSIANPAQAQAADQQAAQ